MTYNDHVTYKVQEQKDIVEAVSASYVVVNKNYIKDGKSTVLIKEKVDTTFASVNENKIAFEGKSSVQWLSIPFKLDYGIDINNTRSQLGLFIGGSLLIKPKVTGYDLSNTQWKDYTVSSDLKSLAWSANAGLRYGFFLNRRLQLNAAAMVNLNPKSIASNYTWINSSGSIQLGVVRYIR